MDESQDPSNPAGEDMPAPIPDLGGPEPEDNGRPVSTEYPLSTSPRAWLLPGQEPPYQTSTIAGSNATRLLSAISSPNSQRPPSPLPRSSSLPRPFQQRRTVSTGQVPEVPGPEQSNVGSNFEPPLRSIFSSGLPTSSVSASTAQASMSSTLPSVRPLEALSSASGSRKPPPRSIDMPAPRNALHTQTPTFLVPEKDVDDPTASVGLSGLYTSGLTPPTNLSRLFVASEGITPGVLSRGASHLRTFSGTARTINDASTLSGHLFHRGYLDGRHSDVTVLAFDRAYKLHKLVLDRVPFFASAFSGAWAESTASEMTLRPDEVDTNITRSAFELALRRVYGAQATQQEDQEAVGLFATACWLDMSDLIDLSVDSLLRQMQPSKLDNLIKLVTNNYYGKAGDRILASAKAMLCKEGWEMPYEYWDHIPAEIIREVIGGDPFYVPGEWERWYLALKLLNRRLKARAIEAGLVSPSGIYIHPKPSSLKFFAVRFDTTYRSAGGVGSQYVAERDDSWVSLYTSLDISPLLVLLDEGIHYVHLRFEQLQQIRTQKDILGVPVLPEKVISDALWMSMELRQRVLNAHEGDLELGLSEAAEEFADEIYPTAVPAVQAHKGKGRENFVEESVEMESGSWDGNAKPRKFWIPGSDVSCVMGGSREAYVSSGNGSEWVTHSNRLSANLEPTDVSWASDFTGSAADVASPNSRASLLHMMPRYSHYPPFRFSAEFPNPRTLKEKKRVYSQTVWYAGSMWNLYIQRVNTSKNQQLGIYLHRAKDRDPSDDPLAQMVPATVDDRIGQLEREMLLRKSERRHRHWPSDGLTMGSGGEAEAGDDISGSAADYDVSAVGESMESTSRIHPLLGRERHLATRGLGQPHKTSQNRETATSTPAQPTGELQELCDDGADDPAITRRRFTLSTLPPYIDARPTVKTYFKIYSPSKAGRLLSIYESAPDRFNFSQSWGWKSSQMVLDDGLGGIAGGNGTKDGKLRYMVVIGNV